jgi:calcium binding protein 39
MSVLDFLGDAVQKIVKRDKKPRDLIRDLTQYLEQLKVNSGQTESNTSNSLAAMLTSELEQFVFMIYGDSSEGVSSHKEPDPKVAREVLDLFFESDLTEHFLYQMKLLEFEGRKYFTRIFEYSLSNRRDISVNYIEDRPQILIHLVSGYDEKDVSIALSCDAMLRSIIQCEELCETFLNITPSLVEPFFKYIESPSFDIHSHAFATFKLLLTAHPELGANYLRENYESFFVAYNRLLSSDNFLCKVQCFHFLGEMLTTRANHDSMMKYVNEVNNLKVAMIALRGPKAIQMAVFQVLKVFIPNPYKADSITRILTQNRQNFIHFLTEFEKDSKDEVLIAHKKEMIEALALLDPPISVNPPGDSSPLVTPQIGESSPTGSPKVQSAQPPNAS